MIFRKTAQGQEELKTRQGGLGARERSVLILVNGVLPSAALAAQLGADVPQLLQALQARGLVEAVPDAGEPRVAAPQRPAMAAPAVQPQASARPDPAAAIAAAQRRAPRVLAEVFGPEADSMAAELLAARTPRAFESALRALQDTLAMYQGRRHAQELVDRIRGTG